MIALIHFDYPPGWQIGLPACLLVLGLAAWQQSRRPMPGFRIAILALFRATVLLPLIFLAARPVWVAKEPPMTAQRPILLLVDRSESMSLEENERTRYQQALRFVRDHLLPALKSADLPVQAWVFAQDA